MARGDRKTVQDALEVERQSSFTLVLFRGSPTICEPSSLGSLSEAAQACGSASCVEFASNASQLQMNANADVWAETICRFNSPQVIIAGCVGGTRLVQLCKSLRQLKIPVMVVIDATTCGAPTALELEKLDVQITKIDAVLSLFASGNRFVYAYPKPEVGASVVVYLPKSRRVVLIERANEPCKGMMGLPAGFLRPMMEDIAGCAARETFEECGIRIAPQNLRLVSVRSNPDRDPRGHVIDHGFLAVIESEEIVLQALCAGDDASDARLVPIEDALKMELASDQGSLLSDAVLLLGINQSGRTRWFEKIVSGIKHSFAGILKGATSEA